MDPQRPWRRFMYRQDARYQSRALFFTSEIFTTDPFYWDRLVLDRELSSDHNLDVPDLSLSAVRQRLKVYNTELKQPLHIILHVNAAQRSEKDDEQIRRLIGTEQLVVSAEWRPTLTLQNAPGERLSCGGRSGTFGGFITDGTQYVGVSCAHVAGPVGAIVTDKYGHALGSVSAQATLTIMARGSVCTPFPPPRSTGASLNKSDCSLVSMLSPVSRTGLAPSITSSLNQYDRITILTPVNRSYAVRSLCIASTLTLGSNRYCYSPLVELYAPSGTTGRGDSGSWGVNVSSQWSTMTVGADTVSTFAMDARDVEGWINASGTFSSAWHVV